MAMCKEIKRKFWFCEFLQCELHSSWPVDLSEVLPYRILEPGTQSSGIPLISVARLEHRFIHTFTSLGTIAQTQRKTRIILIYFGP